MNSCRLRKNWSRTKRKDFSLQVHVVKTYTHTKMILQLTILLLIFTKSMEVFRNFQLIWLYNTLVVKFIFLHTKLLFNSNEIIRIDDSWCTRVSKLSINSEMANDQDGALITKLLLYRLKNCTTFVANKCWISNMESEVCFTMLLHCRLMILLINEIY